MYINVMVCNIKCAAGISRERNIFYHETCFTAASFKCLHADILECNAIMTNIQKMLEIFFRVGCSAMKRN